MIRCTLVGMLNMQCPGEHGCQINRLIALRIEYQ